MLISSVPAPVSDNHLLRVMEMDLPPAPPPDTKLCGFAVPLVEGTG